jgi:hypothetical protein
MVNIQFVYGNDGDSRNAQWMLGTEAHIDKSKGSGFVVITGNTTDRRGSALGGLLG